jgi:hypothetical protein
MKEKKTGKMEPGEFVVFAEAGCSYIAGIADDKGEKIDFMLLYSGDNCTELHLMPEQFAELVTLFKNFAVNQEKRINAN